MKEPTASDWEHIRRQATPDKIGFIVSMMPRRVGGWAFIVFLEHRYFTPVPEAQADFELFAIHWEEMNFILCLIPGSKRSAAEAIARELGLRFADGVPHVGSSKGWAHFPIDLPNIFTVENIAGHFVYKNNPAENKTAEDYEDEAVERAVAESVEKLRVWNMQNKKAAPRGAAV